MLENRAFSALEIKSVDEEQRIIRGIATTPQPDRVGDVIEPFGLRFAKSIPLFLYHNSEMQVGTAKLGPATKAGVPFEATLPKVTEPGRLKDLVDEAWQRVKYKLLTATSIGFKPVRDKVEQLKDGGLRFLEAEVLELSLVPIPMNPGATIHSLKSLYLKSIDAPQRRAALGTQAGAVTDDSTSSRAREQRPKGTTMKSLNELTVRRDEVAGRVKELLESCNGNRAELQDNERTELDSMKAEQKELNVQIDDLQSLEVAVKGAIAVSPSINTLDAGSRARGGQRERDQDKKVSEAEKGIAFAQYVKVKRLAKVEGADARVIADQLKGRIDSRVPMMLKAAVTAGGTASGNWGEQLVGDETGAVADFVEYLRKGTILGKFGQNGIPDLNRVPVRVPLVTATSGGNAQWVGEGKAKPLTSFAYTRTTLEPYKIAAMAVVSEELLRFSSPSADRLLRDALAAAVRERMDIDFISPTKAAVSGVSPASITYGVSQTAASGTGDADDIRTDVRALMAGFISANNPPTTGVWIMSATTALALGMRMNALGQPEFPGVDMNGGRFAGMPVIVSEHVSASSSGHFVVLVNASDIYLWDDGGVRVDTSEHASIEMSDDPENESGTVVSMFQTNRVAFRAERFIDWLKRRSSSVAVLKNANWGEA